MSSNRIKIAIDGPAASGKSTTARLVAERLLYVYIDSGAMYRAVTLLYMRSGSSESDMVKIARDTDFRFENHDGQPRLFAGNEDVSNEIRLPEVTRSIGPIAASRDVREALVVQQRSLGAAGGVVMDGRDIGTVVFPDAELKIFMAASAEERARRRVTELENNGQPAVFDDVLSEIIQRDYDDSNRKYGPLRMAKDAVELDTTSLTLEEQVGFIYERAQALIPSDSSN